MSITSLKKIVEGIPYDVLIDFVENPWYREDCEIFWNSNNNLKDLESGVGNTFSVEYYRDGVEYEGYFVVNTTQGCGDSVTIFFNLDKEVKFLGDVNEY